MMSLILSMAVVFVMVFVPAIETKRNRCHKRPTIVECPNPLPRTCAEWTITVTAKDRYAGNTGILNCPASHSLIGNGSITCMEDGKWSPMNAICVPIATDIGEAAHVRSFRGSTYILVYQRTPRQEAKASCSSMCGTLIEINNFEEQTFINSTIQEIGPSYLFIGLESKDGVSYVWQSGNTTESNKYDNWDSLNLGVGNCAYIGFSQNKWYGTIKRECDLGFHYICESRFD